MQVINIFPWKVYYDKSATCKAYEKINKDYAENCGCEHCLNFNFLNFRKEVFPEKVEKIFQQLGIDCQKEGEVFHLNKIRQGLHNYGGWFHFVGNVECIDDTQLEEDERLTHYIAVDENFSWSFSSDDVTPHDKAFDGLKLSLVYFSVNVPWVIRAEEPE